MSNGFCPSLLYHIDQVAGPNSPGRKIQIAGFLQMLMCCQDSGASILNTAYQGGHYPISTIVKYRKRPLTSLVQSTNDCDIDAQPVYSEFTVPALSHKQISFFLPDDLVYQYCQDASNLRSFPGRPPTQVMNEVWGLFVDHANTLLASLDSSLVSTMATKFGLNKSTNSTLSYLNVNQNGDTMTLQNGVIQLLRDLQENEVCGDVCMVGGGLWSGYDMSLVAQCCNAAGLNLGALGIPKFFFDKNTQTSWGTNQVGVFAPGSVKFLARPQFDKPAFTGYKGTSFFTNIAFPVGEFNGCNTDCLDQLRFDVQIKYIDCPGSYNVNGTPTALTRGYQVIIGIDYTLYTQPTDLWETTDPLFGNNGTWKYVITNSTYSGGAYAAYSGY